MGVRLAIPKGSLEAATFAVLERAWTGVRRRERAYRVYLDDPDIAVKMLRPQEIPTLVADGLYDIGITGRDWVGESGAAVDELLDLEYGRIRVVAAVPESSGHASLGAMVSGYARRRRTLRISSEYLTTASRYVRSLPQYRRLYGRREPLTVTPWMRRGANRAVQIHLSFGATEAKPPEDADAVIDAAETGTTLGQNKLRVCATVLESSACLVANRAALRDPARREKIRDAATLLGGAVAGRRHLHVYVNVEERNLDELLAAVPALRRPTVSRLAEEGWYGVNAVVPKAEYHRLIPELRRLAQGLVAHEPRQLVDLGGGPG